MKMRWILVTAVFLFDAGSLLLSSCGMIRAGLMIRDAFKPAHELAPLVHEWDETVEALVEEHTNELITLYEHLEGKEAICKQLLGAVLTAQEEERTRLARELHDSIGQSLTASQINPWIRRYIFPGAYLPSLSQLAPIFERQRLWLTDLENLRLHYAMTLAAWHKHFQANRNRIAELYDERFCRMWEFYLQACEAGFRWSRLTVFQFQLSKEIDAVPITRDYMVREEDRLRAEAEKMPGGTEPPLWTPQAPEQDDGEVRQTSGH